MSVYVYWARLAESRADHEMRAYQFRALAGGRRDRRSKRLRIASTALNEANRHWLSVVVHMLTWGLS